MKGRIGNELGTIVVPGTFANRANRRRAIKMGLVRIALDPTEVNVGVMTMLRLGEAGLLASGQRRIDPKKKHDFRRNLVTAPTKADMEQPPEPPPVPVEEAVATTEVSDVTPSV